jgi:hypothetical protein
MSYTIEDVVKRHRELSADIAVISERHKQELEPLLTAVKNIELWLGAKMNQDGVQNYKTDAGTAYQSRIKSVKLEDPITFRNFILGPAAQQILGLVEAGQLFQGIGGGIPAILDVIGQMSLWDLADFRPGKKGILKYQEEMNVPVPGVSMTEIININVRGS